MGVGGFVWSDLGRRPSESVPHTAYLRGGFRIDSAEHHRVRSPATNRVGEKWGKRQVGCGFLKEFETYATIYSAIAPRWARAAITTGDRPA